MRQQQARKESSNKSNTQEATELELCVLAIVAVNAPCTAYVVRCELASSLSSFWSSSTGSVYPLMERLRRRKWLESRRSAWGKRGKVTFSVTDAGTARLTAWLSPPLPDWVATYTVDPIRTRLFFLELIPGKRRRSLVREALKRTSIAVERQRRFLAEIATQSHSSSEYFGRLGALRQLEARAAWLTEVGEALIARHG